MYTILCLIVFFFNDTATTEIYTLSLHDALPISVLVCVRTPLAAQTVASTASRLGMTGVVRTAVSETEAMVRLAERPADVVDRKSTRLNSSHANISYAVFCLKKKTTSNTSRCYFK